MRALGLSLGLLFQDNGSGGSPAPVDEWILDTHFWRDIGVWQDDDIWKD